MGKEEMKNKISMALKDPVLQIGFEIICKNLSELEKENEKLKKRCDNYEETISKMERVACDICKETEKDRVLAELKKENAELKAEYGVLSCSVGDFDKLQDKLEEEQRKNNGLSDQLTKAKELLNEFMRISKASDEDFEHDYSELIADAEQFLKGE